MSFNSRSKHLMLAFLVCAGGGAAQSARPNSPRSTILEAPAMERSRMVHPRPAAAACYTSTTSSGGIYGRGTVYSLTPPAVSGGGVD